ncbi:MAG TPA: DNA-formamidopyrimidine glycosylase family protein [Polyangia bacterium]|nr:DNA-formamidopyrimidine glycosylase family protein [Polyangia bacterium]
MPELPEVEVAARNLRRWGLKKKVRTARPDPRAKRIFRPAGPKALEALAGRRLGDVRRIGKNLLLTFEEYEPIASTKLGSAERRHRGRAREPSQGSRKIGVWSHLGMTGKWLRRAERDATPPATRVELDLDDGTRLAYVDRRMFGRFQIVPDARFTDIAEIAALGPDPLADGIDVKAFGERLSRIKTPIKVALLDQTLLAGVGNIQASESLFRAKIDPRRPARALSPAEVKRLAAGIRASIDFTLKSFKQVGADGGDADIGYVEERTMENPFLVYGREGAPCPGRHPGKKSTIVRIVQAQRATFFCPACQE